jgi:PAS domain S-box-containing protein
VRQYAIFTINQVGSVSGWEAGSESIYGYASEEIIGRPASIFFTPEDALSGAPELEFRTAEAEGWAEGERWQVRKDGARFWARSVVAPLVDESGNLRGFVKVTHGITERKHAGEAPRRGRRDLEELEAQIEERPPGFLRDNENLPGRIAEHMQMEKALRESEERYRAFVVNSSEAIWRFALEQPVPIAYSEDEQVECFYRYGYLAECNGAMARMYAFSSPDEMVGIRLSDIVVRSNPENIAFLRNFIRSGYQLTDAETVELDKEGRTKYFMNNLVGIVEGGFILGAWGTNRDVTESKRSQEALRKSEERFRIAAELASDLIYEWDSKNGRMEWSGNVAERLGFEPGEFFQTVEAWEQALHPSDLDRVISAIDRHLATGEPLYEEYRIQRKDGEFLHWTDRRRALRSENGASHKWIGAISDITRRKQAEEWQARLQLALQQSAEEWQLTFDAIQYPVLILDFGGRITQSNRAADEISGCAEGVCAGKSIEMLGAGQPWRKATELVRDALASRSAASCIISDEDTGKTWDITAISLSKAEVGAGRAIIVSRDITRQVELETSLRQSELMAALGTLVAGVAHEARNPLFGISSVLDAFEARFKGPPELQQYMDVLREELGHLKQLMEDLFDYGKPYSQELRMGSIYDVIVRGGAACESLAELGQVKLVNSAPKTLAPIMMDEKRLPQVFSNLIKNAIQYSSPGATVHVEAEEVRLDNRLWVECRVKDSGPGFQIEDIPRIFDPFFTRRHGGTGLGLSIVQRIAQEHNAKVTARNRSEGGAEIVVRIPAERGS